MKATHWIPDCADFADSDSVPVDTPEGAARIFLEDSDFLDFHWDDRDTLVSQGEVTILVRGCHRSTLPLSDEEAFDGYEPGQEYWRYTDEKISVKVRTTYERINGP